MSTVIVEAVPWPLLGVTDGALKLTVIPAGGVIGLRMQFVNESGSQLRATVVAGLAVDQLSSRTRMVYVTASP